jgi:hypothetical protein
MSPDEITSEQLIKILRSGPETWAGTGFDAVMRHQFYCAAADRIESLEQKVIRSRVEGLVECLRSMQAQGDWVAVAQILQYLPRNQGIIRQQLALDSQGRVIIV